MGSGGLQLGLSKLSPVKRPGVGTLALLVIWLLALNSSVATGGEQRAASSDWRYVHSGMIVFAGGGLPANAGQPMCRSVEDLIRWWHTGRLGNCFSAKHGEPVLVERIIEASCPRSSPCLGPYVTLRSMNGRWTGISALAYLMPRIRNGTILVMVSDWGSPCFLWRRPETLVGAVNLGSRAIVSVLRYVPANPNEQLLVRVLTGRFRGRVGWMSISDSLPLPGQGLYGVMPSRGGGR